MCCTESKLIPIHFKYAFHILSLRHNFVVDLSRNISCCVIQRKPPSEGLCVNVGVNNGDYSGHYSKMHIGDNKTLDIKEIDLTNLFFKYKHVFNV